MTARAVPEGTYGGTPASASFLASTEDYSAMSTEQPQRHDHHEQQQPQHSPWDAVRDQLEVLLAQEETHYQLRHAAAAAGASASAPKQPLHEQESPPAAARSWDGGLDATLPSFTFSDGGDLDVCRRKMCEWAFNVVDYFDYSRDLVSTSLSHVDRYVSHLLSSGQEVSKRRFQSVSVTALYLTLKMQGTASAPPRGPHDPRSGAAAKRRHLNIRTFVELSRGILSVEALEEEERRMLDGLGYRVNPPTPVVFVEYLVPLLLSAPGSASSSSSSPRVDDRTLHYVYELSRYYTELAVFERDLSVRHRASCVAFASILCAMSAVDGAAFPPELRRSFANDALGRCTPLLRLGRSEVEDAWSLLANLCPLEALDWPGMDVAHEGGSEQQHKSPRPAQPEEDAISHESPTCVTGFMA